MQKLKLYKISITVHLLLFDARKDSNWTEHYFHIPSSGNILPFYFLLHSVFARNSETVKTNLYEMH
jgi:hypothetical protein